MREFKRIFGSGLIVACTFLPQAALAEADVAKGKIKFVVCEACHGEQGQGNEGFGAPKLAGQRDWYLVTQLENFRAGRRGVHEDDENGQVMRPMAMALTDEDIENVVAYIGTLDPNFVDEDE